MNERFFSLEKYRESNPGLPQGTYDFVERQIREKGSYSQQTIRLKDWREVAETDCPKDRPITERTVEINRGRSREARINAGRIHTDETMETLRRRTLNLP